MKTRNSDELKLDFNSEKYDENYMVIQAFDVYHFGEKCYHISNEQMGISGITYTDFASEDGYEYRDEDYNMANCLQLKTKDGEMVLNASALLYSCGGTSEVCVDEDVNYQLDFAYDIEDYMRIPRGNADNKKEQIKFLLPVPQISITNKLNNFSKKIEGARNGQLFELPL